MFLLENVHFWYKTRLCYYLEVLFWVQKLLVLFLVQKVLVLLFETVTNFTKLLVLLLVQRFWYCHLKLLFLVQKLCCLW